MVEYKPVLDEQHREYAHHFDEIEKQLKRTREYLVAAQAAAWEAFRECGRLRYEGNFIAYQLNYGADVVESRAWDGGFVETHGGQLEKFEELLGAVESARAQSQITMVREREDWFEHLDKQNKEEVIQDGIG